MAKCKKKGQKKKSKNSSGSKCAKLQSHKKKSCMDAGLAEKDTDTPDMKEVKEEMKNLVSEDPDEAFEILTSTSSKRFSEMEEDERNDSQNDRTSDDEDDTDNENTRTGKNNSDSSDETQDSNDQDTRKDTESKTRKYFGQLKTQLKKAAKWLNEN